MNAGNLKVDISFSLDSISLVFCFVITLWVSLIRLSLALVEKDKGFTRFFAYMNLFVSFNACSCVGR